MTTYLCTNPFATSARAVLSSSVADPDFAPSNVSESIAAASARTACRGAALGVVTVALDGIFAPHIAGAARIVIDCVDIILLAHRARMNAAVDVVVVVMNE